MNKLEKEAKAYVKKKKPSPSVLNKPLTARDYFAGIMMASLLQHKSITPESVKRESYAWADFILEKD